MFTRLRIKNFKAWGEQLWEPGVELAPVTLLLGANSAGKTSLLQVPLLLRQTFGSTDRSLDLNLGGQKGDLLDFGSYKDVIHGHDPKAELGFGLTVTDLEAADAEARVLKYEATYGYAGKVPVIHRFRISQSGKAYGADRQLRGGYRLTAPGYQPVIVGKRPVSKRSFRPERSLT
ncbi:MAG: hypothetical protein GXP62_13680, partial [Oligoflexia bacterium]|nr:hypothetical protein [Oligoflexia bacterium]